MKAEESILTDLQVALGLTSPNVLTKPQGAPQASTRPRAIAHRCVILWHVFNLDPSKNHHSSRLFPLAYQAEACDFLLNVTK